MKFLNIDIISWGHKVTYTLSVGGNDIIPTQICFRGRQFINKSQYPSQQIELGLEIIPHGSEDLYITLTTISSEKVRGCDR